MIELGLADYRPERAPEKRVITLADFPQLAGFLASNSTAGVLVNEATAYNFAAYWNGIDIISGQIGTLPFPLYRRLENDQRERATTHPAYKVLTEAPNSFMTPAVFWQTLMAHVLSWGNGYAEIEWDNADRPIGLWTIPPDRLQPVVENGRLRYRNTGRGAPYIEQEDVLHVPGLGFDGIQGYSVIANARRSLALGLAAEEYGSSFFGNGAWPGLIAHMPPEKKLSQAAKERLEASFGSKYGGPAKAHKLLVAEEGMTLEAVGVPPEDAQYMQLREYQVLEIARWLNLPPHKLKHKVGERPGGNIEASQIEFLTDTLRPWLVRIEQEVDRKLIPAGQRGTLYSEHLVDAILRMDSVARAASYKSYYDMGVMDAETIAQKENLPRPKPMLVKVLPPAPVLALPPAPNDRQMRIALRALVADAAARFSRREAERVKRAAKRGADGLAKLDELYADEAMVLRGYLTPAVRLVMAHAGLEGDAEAVAGGLASAYVERSKEELLALPARNVEDSAGQLVARWETGRPLELAELVLAEYGGKHAA